ncbi:DNA-binding protein [Campylobacter concisus]|uniref:DNA-binding protein n=1 Tax=Campylobacter concisus TaxID=199 RepID=UPI000CD8FA20|nr:DNA-binding protein [Campylobacter concisus]
MIETSDIFNLLHNAVEAKNIGKKISQAKMAEDLGVPMRTYQDWRLGNSKPQAAAAVCKLLCELDDDEILFVVNKMRKLLGN